MAPKMKVSKEDILSAAFSLVSRQGIEALNARAIAKELDCSTQPIFSNFSSMAQIHTEVYVRAQRLCIEYIEEEVNRGIYPHYKASGMGYIRFAEEESRLFKLLYLNGPVTEQTPEDGVLWDTMVERADDTAHVGERAGLFHFEMWAAVHGIATMLATKFLTLDRETVSQTLTDLFLGLKKQYGEE